MARALIGGLLSSTVLTLIVLPTYYRIVNEWVAAIRSLVERRRSQAPKSIGRPTPGESAAR